MCWRGAKPTSEACRPGDDVKYGNLRIWNFLQRDCRSWTPDTGPAPHTKNKSNWITCWNMKAIEIEVGPLPVSWTKTQNICRSGNETARYCRCSRVSLTDTELELWERLASAVVRGMSRFPKLRIKSNSAIQTATTPASFILRLIKIHSLNLHSIGLIKLHQVTSISLKFSLPALIKPLLLSVFSHNFVNWCHVLLRDFVTKVN